MSGPQLLMWAGLMWLTLSRVVSSESWANSLWRNGRYDGDVLTTEMEAYGLPSCLMLCEVHEDCRAFNHQGTTNTCELLSSALCDGNDTQVLNRNDMTWRYYDLMDYASQEDEHGFIDKPCCIEAGKCSSKCEREVNQSCTHDEQCEAVENNTYCTATANAPLGRCECNTHYWGYNATLCIHQVSLTPNTWDWIYQRIVHDMCAVTFTLQAERDFHIRLVNYDYFHSGCYYYHLRIGISLDTKSELKRHGEAKVTIDTPGILSNTSQNFTFSWCNGQIRFAKQGEGYLIAWNDPSPIRPIKAFGFHTPLPDAHLFVPHNLVDPYFPTNVESRTIRTNGHNWHQVKILPDASVATNISFTFECKAPRDCYVLFALKTEHTRKYQIAFGANSNRDSRVYNGRTNSWVTIVESVGIVSNVEFRKFWINIEGATVEAGQGDDMTPLLTYTDTASTPSFTHVSVGNCCNQLAFFKVHSHPQFHDYPNGGYVN